jgi:hypothetical protein
MGQEFILDEFDKRLAREVHVGCPDPGTPLVGARVIAARSEVTADDVMDVITAMREARA